MTYTFGLDTFGDRNSDADGKPASHAQTIRNVVEEGVFAERAGVDFFGIGEHHTNYFPMPAGDVVLAAIAAIIGGPPARFTAYSQLFQRALEKFGRAPLPVLVHSPGHVAATDEQAKAEFCWREIIALIAPERGSAIPTEESFDWETGPHGALYVGSPETVAQKIATNLRALGATRFDLKYGMPGLTHDQLMTNIELACRRVIPRVRELLS